MAIVPVVLQNFPLLRDVPAEALARLAATMMDRSYARRGVVIPKGDPGSVLGFLIEGRLQGVDFTVDGREVGLYFVEPNDYFGELSVIDGLPCPEFVIAVGRSRVATLGREEARRLLSSTPAVAQACAMPLPIVPAPMTPTRSIVCIRFALRPRQLNYAFGSDG